MSIELMLDTADIETIRREIKYFRVSGITTNPDILAREKTDNPFFVLDRIKKEIGNRSLHVQVTSDNAEGMIKEAEKIVERLGRSTFVKIPVTKEGLAAMMELKKQDIKITATVIYTAVQGMHAIMCGADYLAVYLNKMMDTNIDPFKVITQLSAFNSKSEVLVASFRNMNQIVDSYAAGATACTVPPALLDKGINNALVNDSLKGFHDKWTASFGSKSLVDF